MGGAPAQIETHTEIPDAVVWAPVAGSALLVVSAAAAWRTAALNARAFRQSILPDIDVTFVRPVPRGPLGVIVRNVGAGYAKVPLLMLVMGDAQAHHFLPDGVLKPGQGFKIATTVDAAAVGPEDTHAVLACRDVRNVHHGWSANWEHREFRDWRRRPRKRLDWNEAFTKFYPGVYLEKVPGRLSLSVTPLGD